ncbi:hypothetical protein [Streptomyces sp. NPDC004270]
MTGAFRGVADDRAADLDGADFGVVALAAGDEETADGEGAEDFFLGDAGVGDAWELATTVAAARVAAGCGWDRFVMIRQTARPTAITAAAVPIISSRLRLRLRLRLRAA